MSKCHIVGNLMLELKYKDADHHEHERTCCGTYNDTVQFLYNTPRYNMVLDITCPNFLPWNFTREFCKNCPFITKVTSRRQKSALAKELIKTLWMKKLVKT